MIFSILVFFYWVWLSTGDHFNDNHCNNLWVETLRAKNELQEVTRWFSTTKWLVMALFSWFCLSFPILVLFTCSFSSNDTVRWQKSCSNFTKISIHRLCKQAEDSEKWAKELSINCFNSSSSTTLYNAWIMTFSAFAFNKLRTEFWRILPENRSAFSISSSFAAFDQLTNHQRL